MTKDGRRATERTAEYPVVVSFLSVCHGRYHPPPKHHSQTRHISGETEHRNDVGRDQESAGLKRRQSVEWLSCEETSEGDRKHSGGPEAERDKALQRCRLRAGGCRGEGHKVLTSKYKSSSFPQQANSMLKTDTRR